MVPDNLLENFESFLDAACNIYRTETKEDLPEEGECVFCLYVDDYYFLVML